MHINNFDVFKNLKYICMAIFIPPHIRETHKRLSKHCRIFKMGILKNYILSNIY